VDYGQIEIGGVAIPAFVLGWVAAAKELGLKGKALTVLAILLSTLLAALWQALATGLVPAAAVPWITVVIVGLGGGVALTGWYDLSKRVGATIATVLGALKAQPDDTL
jgi:hypothetical protein